MSQLKKQFDYADRRHIPFISICGGDESAAGKVNFKNLATGEQQAFDKRDLAGMRAFLGM